MFNPIAYSQTMRKQIIGERYCLSFISVAVQSVHGIVVDPARGRLYVAYFRGVEAINVDGSNRRKLFYTDAHCLAVDLKAG